MALLLKAVLVSTILLSTNAHHIEVDHEREKIDVIIEGLRDFNTPYFGNQKSIHFAVYLKNEKDEVVGGVLAWMRPGIKLLYIDTIWVSESLRNKGYGKKLMLAVEAEEKTRLHPFSSRHAIFSSRALLSETRLQTDRHCPKALW